MIFVKNHEHRIMYTCSSYLTHFLPIRQKFVFFTRGGRKGFRSPCWYIVHIRWSSIFVNVLVVFWISHLVVASQNRLFFMLGKWKMPFWCDKKENFLLQHCLPCHDAHVFTIWPYYHKLCLDSSHNIGHLTRKPRNLEWDRSFCEGFFLRHNQYTKFDIFSSNYVT